MNADWFFFCSKVPAFLNVVDIAGLVKGAAEGQGLGNAFLSHISACDGIFHLCRKFCTLFIILQKLSTKKLHYLAKLRCIWWRWCHTRWWGGQSCQRFRYDLRRVTSQGWRAVTEKLWKSRKNGWTWQKIEAWICKYRICFHYIMINSSNIYLLACINGKMINNHLDT